MLKKRRKIFLIEDDSAIIDIYEMMIKKAHLDVEVITKGQEMVRKIKNIENGEEAKPDLILLDLILPDINGIEVLKEIRRSDTTKDIAVFILTNQTYADSQKLDNIKPDKFITKVDITPSQLIVLIKEQLKLK